MTVTVNEGALQLLLHDTGGQMGVFLSRLGIQGESLAKLNASGRPGPRVRTGRLRASIGWQVGTDFRSAYVDVGSPVHYALPLETGLRNGARYPFLAPAVRALAAI